KPYLVDIPRRVAQSVVRPFAAIAGVYLQGLDCIHFGPCHSVGIDRDKFAYAGHPPSRDDERQSQIGDLLRMRKHAFLYKRQTGHPPEGPRAREGSLSTATPQQHHRPATIDNDRAFVAEPIERASIENIDARRRDSAIEFRG